MHCVVPSHASQSSVMRCVAASYHHTETRSMVQHNSSRKLWLSDCTNTDLLLNLSNRSYITSPCGPQPHEQLVLTCSLSSIAVEPRSTRSCSISPISRSISLGSSRSFFSNSVAEPRA